VSDCVFCARIERGEYDYEDKWSVAFQPLSPVTPGHFLVVPRKHVSHALESPRSAGKALELAGYLANQMSLESANFITSAGKAATQSVFHLHVHVVPRREGDGLALPWTGQAEREGRAKPPAIVLLEEALFLRMNGERAPGGNENWRDWDDKAERFLRSLLPEPDVAP
jgi:histidine triad (HIT) family protein